MFAVAPGTGYSFDRRDDSTADHRHFAGTSREDTMSEAPDERTRRRTSLSDKQLAILEMIQRSVSSRGYPPSMREIGDAVGLSSLSSVTHQLNQLELAGYLRRDPNRPRALEVLIELPGVTDRPATQSDPT